MSFQNSEGVLGDSLESHQANQGSLHMSLGIGPHLAARGKSHGFSHVAAGTWGTFSSYGGDGR